MYDFVQLLDEWWGTVWSEVQMICIRSSWCYCHLIISCSSNIQNGLPFWCRLTRVVLEKRPLNWCSSSWWCFSIVNVQIRHQCCAESQSSDWTLSDLIVEHAADDVSTATDVERRPTLMKHQWVRMSQVIRSLTTMMKVCFCLAVVQWSFVVLQSIVAISLLCFCMFREHRRCTAVYFNFIMVALWNRADHCIFMLWFVLSFFFLA